MKDFSRFVFHPGMMFNSSDKWWGDFGKRMTIHEGLDLCSFEDNTGHIKNINEQLIVPATFDGIVVKLEKDFLGTTIYLIHNLQNNDNAWLYTIYGHVSPKNFIKEGEQIHNGTPLASVQEFPIKKSGMRPHLHISFAWAEKELDTHRLTWPNLNKDPEIKLIDPLEILNINKPAFQGIKKKLKQTTS